MAPIPFLPKPGKELVVMQPASNVVCLKPAHFEEEPFKAMQNSRIMRCTSVSSEEEESSFLLNKHEYYRSLVSVKTSKTSLLTVCNSTRTLSTELWPGVSAVLDEDERQVKVKRKVALLEPELEKKTAVENDDDSSSSRESFGSLALFECTVINEKYTRKTSSQIQLKNEKCELKTKEIFVVPYSVQETDNGGESEAQTEQIIPQIKLPVPTPNSTDTSSGEEDCAEVQVEELNLEEHVKSIETKHKSLFRRHAVRKVKRSIWSIITEPEPPPIQHKKKKTCKTVNARKRRQPRSCVRNKLFPEVDNSEELNIVTKQPSKKASKRKVPTSPVREEPRDSGVYSNGAGGGCGGGYSSGSGSDSGSFSGESGSAGGSGERGNGGGKDSGDDGDKGKKFPRWHLPEGDNPVPEGDKDKGKDDDDGSQEKMEVDIPTNGFQTFLPSKVDNAEQCHSPDRCEAITTGQKFDFSKQDLQHACYCSKPNCFNMKCKIVKAEVEHMQAHKGWKQCVRCVNTREVVKQHAQFCRMNGCRVPECEDSRKGNHSPDISTGQPVPVQLRTPAQVRQQEAWLAPRTLHYTPLIDKTQVDGKVIFRNSTLLPENYFTEHAEYNVNRNDKLGGGSHGEIYPVYLQSDRSIKMVVKETNYVMQREEVEVYKLLGDHEHIVKHHGGTFRGSKGKASVFMEKCDESLFDYMEKLQRRLSPEEAMFFFTQVVAAVCYLHNLPIPVIHKDIKAKNVLLSEEYSRAKLADFDSAKRLPAEFTEAGLEPLGTKGFVSPEVWEKQPHGRPADVYSLGCFLVELTIGVPTNNTLQEKLNELQELEPDLAQFVEACVQEYPEDRPTARMLLEWPVVKKYTRS